MYTGELLNELDSAHYLAVSTIAISWGQEFVATGGKDNKVKVWVLSSLLAGEQGHLEQALEGALQSLVDLPQRGAEKLPPIELSHVAQIDETHSRRQRLVGDALLETVVFLLRQSDGHHPPERVG